MSWPSTGKLTGSEPSIDRLIVADRVGGGASPFSLAGLISLCESVSERVRSLRSVEHDSFVITSSGNVRQHQRSNAPGT